MEPWSELCPLTNTDVEALIFMVWHLRASLRLDELTETDGDRWMASYERKLPCLWVPVCLRPFMKTHLGKVMEDTMRILLSGNQGGNAHWHSSVNSAL